MLYKLLSFLLTYILPSLLIYLFCSISNIVPNVGLVFIRLFQVQITCLSFIKLQVQCLSFVIIAVCCFSPFLKYCFVHICLTAMIVATSARTQRYHVMQEYW